PWSARDFVIRRGFVEGMSLSGRAFISLGGPLFRMTPLREVRLVAVGWYMDELARTPYLARIERLDLSGNNIGPTGMRHPAASSFLGHLTDLELESNSLGQQGLAELLAASWRIQLRSLGLAGNAIDSAAFSQLLTDTGFNGLIELDLSSNQLDSLPSDWPRL